MRYIKYLFLGTTAVVLIVVALANRGMVTLRVLPDGLAGLFGGPFEIRLPLFLVITALFIPVNSGLGLRGPPGFFRAILASLGDDARGSGLVILFLLATSAIGTALVSPWIDKGTIPLAGMALAFHLAAGACLLMLPKLGATDPSV